MADPSPRTAVVVPLRSFAGAKARLAPVLDHDRREALGRALAGRVLAAAGTAPVIVVTADGAVADWARDQGAEVIDEGGPGLDHAAAAGRAAAIQRGHERVAIVHGDLPLVTDLAPLLERHEEVVLAPDRHGDGTNALVIPTRAGFRFAYGPGSFDRHRAEVEVRHLSAAVVRDPALAFDIDTPDDLADLAVLHPDVAAEMGLAVGRAR